MKSIKNVVISGNCIGCGICTVFLKKNAMRLDNNKSQFIPDYKAFNGSEYDSAFALCPGKGYNIIAKSKEIFGGISYDINLGHYISTYVSRSLNNKILANASSGGVMTEILLFLIENKMVDKVIVTKFKYSNNGPISETILTDSVDEIIESQGSKYCPVDISEAIKKAIEINVKIAIVGTPCQIAGIRNLQKEIPKLKENIVLTIANFCGGFKDYRNIVSIIKRSGMDVSKIISFRFRGGGQPGSMKIEDSSGYVKLINYPKYTAYTGYSKHYRCHVCIDATGELADLSCGDAWLAKYQNQAYPWSFIITRSNVAKDLLNKMANHNRIVLKNVIEDEVIKSQEMNLRSKKNRQYSRYKLYKFLGCKIPYFDGGFIKKTSSICLEIKILMSHKLRYFLERIGLYWFVYSRIKNKMGKLK